MKRFSKIFAGLAILLMAVVGVFWRDIQDFRAVMTYVSMFEPENIDQNFRSMYIQYPSVTVKRGGEIAPLQRHQAELPQYYLWRGLEKKVEDFIDASQTTGLVILKDGKLVTERYLRGNHPDDRVINMSVSKSIVSAIFGMVVEDRLIQSIEDPVDKYAPSLAQGGYKGVSIKNVLQMSSGIAWNEDYGDLESDIVQSVVAMLNGDLNRFADNRQNELEPGTYHRYASMDTHVLSMVLEGATGKKLAALVEERLWSKIGAENDLEIILDSVGNAVAFGGFNISTRDMARIGQLFLDNGKNWQGEQIVPAHWVTASVTPDAPHLQPGRKNPASDWPMGYGYQWWIPEPAPDGSHPGDFSAIGIYGQFIYVSPKHNVVIAKSSAYENYNDDGHDMETESMEVFRTIAAAL